MVNRQKKRKIKTLDFKTPTSYT